MKSFDSHALCLSGLATDSNSVLLEIDITLCAIRPLTRGLLEHYISKRKCEHGTIGRRVGDIISLTVYV